MGGGGHGGGMGVGGGSSEGTVLEGGKGEMDKEGWGCVLVAGGLGNERGCGKGGKVHACMYVS